MWCVWKDELWRDELWGGMCIQVHDNELFHSSSTNSANNKKKRSYLLAKDINCKKYMSRILTVTTTIASYSIGANCPGSSGTVLEFALLSLIPDNLPKFYCWSRKPDRMLHKICVSAFLTSPFLTQYDFVQKKNRCSEEE